MTDVSGHVAFMPWLAIDDGIDLAACRLVRYERDAEDATSPVRRILDCYRSGLHPIEQAAVFEHDGVQTKALTPEQIENVFVVREALSFAAMRHREFFGNAYCSHDTFTTIVQGFEGDKGGALVNSRRRDGGNRTFYFDGVHEVRCPPHVDLHFELKPDLDLVRAIQDAFRASEDVPTAVRFYNLANTDAPNVPEASEVILLSAALQAALGITDLSGTEKIVSAFEERMFKLVGAGIPRSESTRLAVAAQEKDGALRDAWLRDFYRARSGLAHGDTTKLQSLAWSAREHLLLAAWLLPRLLERRLVEEGHLSRAWTESTPIGELEDFDALLKLDDAFGATDNRGLPAFHWTTAIRASQGDRLRSRIIEELRSSEPSAGTDEDGQPA